MIKKNTIPSAEQALSGRATAMPVPKHHAVLNTPLLPPFDGNLQLATFGLGCFWGAERCFWSLSGVYSTAVGYTAGYTPNPTYEEVCSGQTGHNEAVLIVFDPQILKYEALLKVFWQAHNPTQGMRQGNDKGTQYRSGIYTHSEIQQALAEQSKARYQTALKSITKTDISTEIVPATAFYYAETYHQQYLHKNPQGYCGLGGLGIDCPE